MGQALLLAAFLSQEMLAQATEAPPPPPPPPAATVAPGAPAETVAKQASAPAETPAPADAPPPARVYAETQTTMGVRTQVQVFMEDEEGAKAAIAAAFDEIRRVEELLSEWKPNSDITRLNKAAGKAPVVISAEASQVLTRGKQIALLTGGAFSLTWAALASLWDFSAGPNHTLPAPERIAERLGFIDDTRLKLDKDAESAFLERPGMAVGVGGLAKGYAVHRALTVLKSSGARGALVFVGGDIGVRGKKGDKPWVIGIQDPRATGFFAVLPLTDTSIATTGDYEQFFELDGKRYHHILDPRTGMPATACRSASVIAGDAVTADALATAVFVLGPTEGMALIERMDGVEAVIVAANNEISMSTGLEKALRIVRPPSE